MKGERHHRPPGEEEVAHRRRREEPETLSLSISLAAFPIRRMRKKGIRKSQMHGRCKMERRLSLDRSIANSYRSFRREKDPEIFWMSLETWFSPISILFAPPSILLNSKRGWGEAAFWHEEPILFHARKGLLPPDTYSEPSKPFFSLSLRIFSPCKSK